MKCSSCGSNLTLCEANSTHKVWLCLNDGRDGRPICPIHNQPQGYVPVTPGLNGALAPFQDHMVMLGRENQKRSVYEKRGGSRRASLLTRKECDLRNNDRKRVNYHKLTDAGYDSRTATLNMSDKRTRAILEGC